MKFGQHMQNSMVKEWEAHYMQYNKLKNIINHLEQQHVASPQPRGYLLSMSIPPSTNAAAQPQTGSTREEDLMSATQEEFFHILEADMQKVQDFTDKRIVELRDMLGSARLQVQGLKNVKRQGRKDTADFRAAKAALDELGSELLRLEKYVNLNFTGFQKILKKHDKRLPSPCRAFYLKRLHAQPWVRISITEIMSALGELYAALRGDATVEQDEERIAADVQHARHTMKRFWVPLEYLTDVQYRIMQQLAVSKTKPKGAKASDSDASPAGAAQLMNTVYLDNDALELYRGRLLNAPGAMSLRFRWYDTAMPETVVVERKVPFELVAGARDPITVRDSFTVDSPEISGLFDGGFDSKGDPFVRDVMQAINIKQLVPTLRVQCMRTTFTDSRDITMTLDTNVTMVLERQGDSENALKVGETGVWFRDPSMQVHPDQIKRFPHAILELRMRQTGKGAEGFAYPDWLQNLIQSGTLTEKPGFSHYVHACAVLMPEDVQTLPYWANEPDLGFAAPQEDGEDELPTNPMHAGRRVGPYSDYGSMTNVANTQEMIDRRRASRRPLRVGYNDEDEEPIDVCRDMLCGCLGSQLPGIKPQILKGEPKVFFANERTFIHWLHMAITLAGVGSAVLAFAPDAQTFAEVYGFTVLLVSLFFVVYAVHTFLWRAKCIKDRAPTQWDAAAGPVVMAVVLTLTLSCDFIFEVLRTSRALDQVANEL